MHQISLEDAQTQFSLLIQKVMAGQEVVIMQGNMPVVKLVSIPRAKPQAQFGSAKNLITISDDFDAPLEDFKEYMQ